jgi:hypothetical protein
MVRRLRRVVYDLEDLLRIEQLARLSRKRWNVHVFEVISDALRDSALCLFEREAQVVPQFPASDCANAFEFERVEELLNDLRLQFAENDFPNTRRFELRFVFRLNNEPFESALAVTVASPREFAVLVARFLRRNELVFKKSGVVSFGVDSGLYAARFACASRSVAPKK